MEHTISIIYGSVRTDRQGIKAVKYLEQKLQERNIKVNFIDPLEYQLPLLDKMYKEFKPGTAPESMEKISKMLSESDGFLIVTGEYNHSLPPALKNMLDHFQREYYFKPSAIASYSAGSFGGVRAAVHLRVVVGELGMPAISSMLPFPVIGELFDDRLNPKNERIELSTNRFIDELLWYVQAFTNQRNKGVPY
ncbi:NADPH-dependent FMN reductase [Prolixibacter sp. NT017]|uniref:NADPH-dependent FMN reductase n=1 Tax=Prolixibacter sp. NT017 TaxID=2652390 RepID=UPI001288BAB0|nr:NAD(P)H-dependent oxidoreductase [Prolixibacter sp. NT017]GET24424.1 FMN reductase [Prolixibacter sp. NT017]